MVYFEIYTNCRFNFFKAWMTAFYNVAFYVKAEKYFGFPRNLISKKLLNETSPPIGQFNNLFSLQNSQKCQR
jgi:hypothetical protein